MTVYHGSGSGTVAFTGFDLWSWKRSQIVSVVDVILGNVLGQSRSAAPGAVSASRDERMVRGPSKRPR